MLVADQKREEMWICYKVVRCCKLYVFDVCIYNDDDLK